MSCEYIDCGSHSVILSSLLPFIYLAYSTCIYIVLVKTCVRVYIMKRVILIFHIILICEMLLQPHSKSNPQSFKAKLFVFSFEFP